MTLKIGWIGCGTHATQMLLPQLMRHDVEIAALCDLDGQVIRTLTLLEAIELDEGPETAA